MRKIKDYTAIIKYKILGGKKRGRVVEWMEAGEKFFLGARMSEGAELARTTELYIL